MSEITKKAAAAAKKLQDDVSTAVSAARTRTGKPKVTKPAPRPAKELTEPMKTVGELLDAYIAYETELLAAATIPDDTGDAMAAAVDNVLYHKERITKAQLAKKYLEEG